MSLQQAASEAASEAAASEAAAEAEAAAAAALGDALAQALEPIAKTSGVEIKRARASLPCTASVLYRESQSHIMTGNSEEL